MFGISYSLTSIDTCLEFTDDKRVYFNTRKKKVVTDKYLPKSYELDS